MAKKKSIIIIIAVVIAIVISAVVIIAIKGKTNSPTYIYKQSMIEILNDYRVGKIDRKEAHDKLQSVGTKLKDIGDEKYQLDADGLSITANSISYDLLSGDATGAQIDKWIKDIEFYD